MVATNSFPLSTPRQYQCKGLEDFENTEDIQLATQQLKKLCNTHDKINEVQDILTKLKETDTQKNSLFSDIDQFEK